MKLNTNKISTKWPKQILEMKRIRTKVKILTTMKVTL